MRLLLGATCAGKSTFAEDIRKQSARDGSGIKLHFAFDISGDAAIPTGDDDLVHFNLLRGYTPESDGPLSVGERRLLPKLIEAADEVIVICAPRPVLLERASGRAHCEPNSEPHANYVYHTTDWQAVLRTAPLPQIYEHLALHLDARGKKCRYLCSNARAHGGEGFTPISRWDFPLSGGADAETHCDHGHSLTTVSTDKGSYQADYRSGATKLPRAATLALALQMPLDGKTLLDIGCAEGAASLSAGRMGARVTGIEPWAKRFNQARRVATSLGSPVTFKNIAFEALQAPSNSFDVVLALNVVHHQKDPFAFLNHAADLAGSYLVVEYPGLNDRKFQSTFDHAGDLRWDLPLTGLSTVDKDQTFVFSPAALERYFIDTVGAFGHHQLVRSPIPRRWISIFSDKKAASESTLKEPVAHQLRRELARERKKHAGEVQQLRTTISKMRASRSWRLTAPLRRLSYRVRSRASTGRDRRQNSS